MIKQTIYEALAAKLGRVPTNAELKADVQRIKDEALVELASNGKLKFLRPQAGGFDKFHQIFFGHLKIPSN